jgi:hypothetical protein
MSKHFAVWFTVLVLTLAAAAQDVRSTRSDEDQSDPSWTPHPIVFGGPSLVGSGYQSFALNAGGGFLINADRLVGDVEGSYENARKTDDNTIDNISGHERFLQGRFFYHYSQGLYFGGGAQWSETSTTNYDKSAWRPTFGAGGDHFGNGYSMRWQAVYVMPGTDHYNAVQGPELQFWLPSPSSRSHFFYRQTIGIYEYHATITDPTNASLTAQQKANRSGAAFLDFDMGWRF